MKAKELQIGDFVEYGGKYLYYSGIFSDFTPLSNEPYRRLRCMFNDHEGLDIPETKVNPIPLTEEMLKANGFFQNSLGGNLWMYVEHWAKEEGEDQCDVYVHLHEDSYFLEIENNYNDDALYERTLHFVHEFQHALRLCGLKELADNFKVK